MSGPREHRSQSSVSSRLRHGPIQGESRAGVTGGGGGVLGEAARAVGWEGGLRAARCALENIDERCGRSWCVILDDV